MSDLPSWLLLILGVGLVILIIVDFFGTTLTPRSFRLMAAAVAGAVWRNSVIASERTARPRLRELAGPVIIVTVFGNWVLLTWIAWTLVFVGDRYAVVEAVSGNPATFWERVYYVGFTLSTLGVGDYRAGDDLSRVLTAVAAKLRAARIPLCPGEPQALDDGRDARRREAVAAWVREAGWLWGPPAGHATPVRRRASLRRVGGA